MNSLSCSSHLLRLACLLPLLAASAFAQQDPAQTEARLREALRTTTLQLRAAQSELAAAQVVKGEIEKERDTLRQQLEAANRRAAAAQAEAEKNAAALAANIKEKDAQIAQFAAEGAKWKKAAEDTTDVARKLDVERDRLDVLNSELTRRASEREAQNVELVRIAQEILTRFERFGLGDALAAKEPFIGVKRARLKILVQDYADKILDQKAAPEPDVSRQISAR